MATIFLALGTNLGDRDANLQAALEKLVAQIKLGDRSPIYETEPWGLADQPRFLNMVVSGETALEPAALLGFLKGIESAMGRERGIRYGPRVIDLDVLFYDDEVINDKDLVVPHPRLAERRFVLVPLADIARRKVHPSLGLTVGEMLHRLPDDRTVRPHNAPNQ